MNSNNEKQIILKKGLDRFKRLRIALAMMALIVIGLPAHAQTQYVFMYNGYFLGSNTTTPTTSFVPNASIYTGSSGSTFRNGNNYYIRYNNGLTFSTTQSTALYIYNNYLGYAQYGEQYISYGYFYPLNMNNPNNNNRAWRMSNNNSNQATVYAVNTEVVKSLSDFTITGDNILTSATSYPFTHSNSLLSNYTKYSWTGYTYYSTNPAQAASTTVPAATEVTTGYTWSLEGGGSYASVNASTGQITVSSLPANDLTMTITCSVTSNGVTKTAQKTVVLYASTIAEPTITRMGNDITLSTSSANATIYYTTDGSTPTSSSTVYTGPFSIENLTYPVTVKAIAVRNGNSSTAASQTYSQPKCATPVINISSTGAVTITCATEGATIRYTTGTTMPADPTESTGTAGSSTTLTNLQYIKAKAFKSGYDASEVETGQYITSGVTTDGKVILNDREDHSWSYYSDPECPIRSLSPADVKITYYGDGIVMTGNADYTASSVSGTDYVLPSNTTDYVGGAKVNVGEDENTFVYYKTLERGDNTQTAWTFSAGNQSSAASRCPYTAIPNPFQVRPTYGGTATTNTADWSGWRGFQCWRLKSVTGGAVYSAASGGSALSAGAIINANTEIYFAPNSEYNMEVDFEAVWARAYVVKASDGGANAIGDHSSLGYERNFIVLNTTNSSYNFGGTSGKRITNIDRQVTVSNYLPNGVRGQNNDATYIRGAANNYNLTLQANTKFENVNFNMASNTLTAAENDLIIGRGCTGTVQHLYGVSSAPSVDFRLRIESGTFTDGFLLRNVNQVSSAITINTTLGCDYDRANNETNTNLTFGLFEVGYGSYCTSPNGKINVTVLSGTYGSDAADKEFYLGFENGGTAVSQVIRALDVYGGNFLGGIAGGFDKTGNTASDVKVKIRVRGGATHRYLYGAGQYSECSGARQIVITGGTYDGWIAGGAYGTSDSGGETDGDMYVYFGGKANQTSTEGIFGAGYGTSATGTGKYTVQKSAVIIADESQVAGNVYGGGNNGYAEQDVQVYVAGGTVEGNVFGGANMARSSKAVNVTMTGGLVKTGIYGGSNASGTVTGPVTMHINGGQVGTSSSSANIHGGGYGNSTVVSGNVDLTLGTDGQTTPGVTVYGDVYGGSALGSVNGTSATNTYHTYVTLNKGIINGSLYGGALGSNSVAANVYGPVTVTVNGGSVRKTDANGANGSGGVYGANNINGAPQRAVTVDIYHTDPAPSANEYALYAVYGGGNHADYLYGNGYPKVSVRDCENSIEYVYGGGNAADVASTEVKIYGGNVIGNVFGGGNGTVTPANVTGNAQTYIYGGTILKVFGGSNSQGTIGGTIKVDVAKDLGADCPMHVGEIYGGGNMANSQAGSITIGCTGSASNNEAIDYVYGGANQANISGNIELNITGGRINNVYGGNNTSGTVSGTITVNVNWADNGCDNYLGNVYGGGNLAEYSAPSGSTNYPVVNIKDGTVSGSVFGGGNGDPNSSTQEPGQVTGNPQVTIGDNDDACHAIVRGNVYGGGNAAKVTGDTFIHLKNRAKVFGNIYGGGNMGPVDGNTNVIVNGKRL